MPYMVSITAATSAGFGDPQTTFIFSEERGTYVQVYVIIMNVATYSYVYPFLSSWESLSPICNIVVIYRTFLS